MILLSVLHYVLSCGTVYCNWSCLWVCLCVYGWVCYYDNSKLHTSILTKLGLSVRVVTISSWLNFGLPAPPGRGLRRGENFWLHLTTARCSVCISLSAFFI